MLTNFTTKEIVDELIRRKGVDATVIAPYDIKSVEVEGPAIVLVVID